MKNYIIALLFLSFLSCSTDENVLDDITTRGGYVQFAEDPVVSFNIFEIDYENFVFNAAIEDNNNNAQSYTLSLYYHDVEYENFLTINSLPATLSISMQDILTALGFSSVDELDDEPQFAFVATVVSDSGTYLGIDPEFDPATGQLDGNTSFKLFTYSQKDAMNFGIEFFLPPPAKFRGTSFEEPIGNIGSYNKEGGATDQEFLHNHSGENSVEYTEVGTGANNELGFTTEFIPVAGLDGFTTEDMGVQDMPASVGVIEDGVQAYKVEDIDGMIRLKIDRVEIPSGQESGIYMFFYPRLNSSGSVNFDPGDIIHIYAEVEKTNGTVETVEMLNIEGADIQTLGGQWNEIDTGWLQDVAAYTLYIDATNDHGNEDIYFDNIVFYTP